jgi:hypothetical protein
VVRRASPSATPFGPRRAPGRRRARRQPPHGWPAGR